MTKRDIYVTQRDIYLTQRDTYVTDIFDTKRHT